MEGIEAGMVVIKKSICDGEPRYWILEEDPGLYEVKLKSFDVLPNAPPRHVVVPLEQFTGDFNLVRKRTLFPMLIDQSLVKSHHVRAQNAYMMDEARMAFHGALAAYAVEPDKVSKDLFLYTLNPEMLYAKSDIPANTIELVPHVGLTNILAMLPNRLPGGVINTKRQFDVHGTKFVMVITKPPSVGAKSVLEGNPTNDFTCTFVPYFWVRPVADEHLANVVMTTVDLDGFVIPVLKNTKAIKANTPIRYFKESDDSFNISKKAKFCCDL